MHNSRREFLKAVGALGAASGMLMNLPIAIGADRSSREAERKYRAVLKPTGQKIKSVETFTSGNVSIVRIRTDAGAEGYGQISTYDADISAMIMHRKIARHALAKDPGEIDAIVDRCIEANYKYPWSFVCRALAGLDTAIWDLLAKREERSVCELLGGKRRPIVAYGSSMSRSIKPADEAARLVRLKETQGFRAFKIRIGKVNGHDQDQWPGGEPSESSRPSERPSAAIPHC